MNTTAEVNLPVKLEGKFSNSIIAQFSQIIKQKPKVVSFDFRRVYSFDSFGLVTATCLILKLLRLGMAVKYLHPINTEVTQYLKDIGFGELFQIQSMESLDCKNSELGLRLKALTTADGSFISQAADFLAKRVKMSQGIYDWIWDALCETIDNAMTHSGTKLAIVCGRTYPDENKVDICVGDIGMGIPEHLRKNPSYTHITSDKNALLKAMEYGVTGTIGGGAKQNAGAGLHHLKSIAIKSGGDMRSISLEGMYYTAHDRKKPIARKLDGILPGTIVGASFKILGLGQRMVLKTKNGKIF